MVTQTSEYTVKDTCLAIQLFNGDFIFADKVCPRNGDLLYVPRGRKLDHNGVCVWDRIATSTIVEVTVGICPLGACQG